MASLVHQVLNVLLLKEASNLKQNFSKLLKDKVRREADQGHKVRLQKTARTSIVNWILVFFGNGRSKTALLVKAQSKEAKELPPSSDDYQLFGGQTEMIGFARHQQLAIDFSQVHLDLDLLLLKPKNIIVKGKLLSTTDQFCL